MRYITLLLLISFSLPLKAYDEFKGAFESCTKAEVSADTGMDSIPIHINPNSFSNVIFNVPSGTPVEVLGTDIGSVTVLDTSGEQTATWVNVIYKNSFAFISALYLDCADKAKRPNIPVKNDPPVLDPNGFAANTSLVFEDTEMFGSDLEKVIAFETTLEQCIKFCRRYSESCAGVVLTARKFCHFKTEIRTQDMVNKSGYTTVIINRHDDTN